MTVVYAERSLSQEYLFLPETTTTFPISKNPNPLETEVPCTLSDTSPRDDESIDHSCPVALGNVSALPPPAPPAASSRLSSTNQPILQVTIRGIPSNSDLLSFSFLKPFGAVIEGRMISDMMNLYSPDGSSRMSPVFTGVVVFVLAAHSIHCAENLLSLSGATVNSSTFLFSVSLPSTIFALPPHNHR
jgi:hypothetical protein